jgi:hypothetical protein
MLTKLNSMFGNFMGRARIYSYRPGVTAGDLGAGAQAYALMKPISDPILAPYNALNTPKRQLSPYQGGFLPGEDPSMIVNNAVRGGQFTGSIALQALADFQAGTNGKS